MRLLVCTAGEIVRISGVDFNVTWFSSEILRDSCLMMEFSVFIFKLDLLDLPLVEVHSHGLPNLGLVKIILS